ncbi:hypothetical protein SAMD00019534_121220 [Acytostelium subglobosum LB1]|uniref:hypothetical protein n=1 Tax=Acytostelium subglobosum LB1 TaxID=1410327 RepID=UPI000644B527|nr:hypothetical protein SAMD00019534_121220 [Acytostelium subglobosum LB1]GAM28946.1 hypothetical protein SAMD00019534_121220 [Acytostelium subglobosum LB1]|eukprot:XP_012748131.1 hypothetical protein SAMD00019534_121220 [Acytostelium subglobosum LB1]
MTMLTIVTNHVINAELDQIEFDSLLWIAQQYKTGWNVKTNACAAGGGTDPGANLVECVTNDHGNQSVTSIFMTSYINTINLEPSPDMTALVFPYLKSFRINVKVGPVYNSSFSLLDLLDNQRNGNLSEIIIESTTPVTSFSIPPQFPKYIPLIKIFAHGAVLETDIPTSLFNAKMVDITFKLITFTNANPKIGWDKTTRLSNLTNLVLDCPPTGFPDIMITLAPDTLPKLQFIELSFKETVNITIESPVMLSIILSSTSISIANVSNCPIIQTLSLDGFVPLSYDFRSMTVLNLLSILRNGLNSFPTMFGPSVTGIDVSGNMITSIPEMDFQKVAMVQLTNNKLLTSLPEAICTVPLIDINNTSLTNIPDCLYCYWDIAVNKPVNIIPPSSFFCNLQLDKNMFTLTPNNTKINLRGKNLGGYYKDTHDPNMTPVILNHEMIYTPQAPFGVDMIVYFSDSLNYTKKISWNTDMIIVSTSNSWLLQ